MHRARTRPLLVVLPLLLLPVLLFPILLFPIGCALTYDVEQREAELYRQQIDARVDDLVVDVLEDGAGSWVLRAHYHQVERFKVRKFVSRRLSLGVSDRGITRHLLSGNGSSSIHPAFLVPFAALFDLTSFILSVPAVWTVGAIAARDGERTDLESGARWLPCERAVLGEADNPYAYFAPRLDHTGRSVLASHTLRGSGLAGRMWTVDCRGERETLSIPVALWHEIARP